MSDRGFILPRGSISSPYGWRIFPMTGTRRLHRGADFALKLGTPIKSIAPGVVTAKGVNLDKTFGYGYWVAVRNYDGTESLYAHMREHSPLSVGAKVTHASVVGYVGSTGASTGPHLHLEIRLGGVALDPIKYAKDRPVPKPAAKPTPAQSSTRRHVVRRGESLSSIASKYRTTWQALYALNRKTIGANPNRLFAGQVLVLDGAPAAKPSTRTHVVARGETLGSIASKYGKTWQKIHADNRSVIGSNPNLIRPGQRLVIK